MSRRRRALIIAVWIAGFGAMGVFLLDVMRPAVQPPETTRNLAFPSADRAAAPAEVWAVGDGAGSTAAAEAVAEHIRRARPDRVLYLGDVYQHGTASEFRAHFTGVYRRLAKRMAPTPGGSAEIVGNSTVRMRMPATIVTSGGSKRASAVALRKVGSGKVTQTEAGDEEGAYEVEVTKPDGSQVDVRLDKQFNVTQVESDHEDSADDHGSQEGPQGDGDGETTDDAGTSSSN